MKGSFCNVWSSSNINQICSWKNSIPQELIFRIRISNSWTNIHNLNFGRKKLISLLHPMQIYSENKLFVKLSSQRNTFFKGRNGIKHSPRCIANHYWPSLISLPPQWYTLSFPQDWWKSFSSWRICLGTTRLQAQFAWVDHLPLRWVDLVSLGLKSGVNMFKRGQRLYIKYLWSWRVIRLT